MKQINVTTLDELRTALDAGDVPVVVGGEIVFTTGGAESPLIIVRGEGRLRVEAWGSSQPRVVAWESSQPHVEAHGNVQLSVRGAVTVIAAAAVAITVSGGSPTIEGGGFISRVDRSTPQKWCEFYGVETSGGQALLYKAVRDDFRSKWGTSYAPGTTPEATDWDGGKEECGGGLHFSPCPPMALEFDLGAKRFIACPILLSEMVVHPDGKYPEKCKAKRLAAPGWEVDRLGTPVDGAVVNWPPASPDGSAPNEPKRNRRAKKAVKR